MQCCPREVLSSRLSECSVLRKVLAFQRSHFAFFGSWFFQCGCSLRRPVDDLEGRNVDSKMWKLLAAIAGLTRYLMVMAETWFFSPHHILRSKIISEQYNLLSMPFRKCVIVQHFHIGFTPNLNICATVHRQKSLSS